MAPNLSRYVTASNFLGYGAPTPVTDELHPYIMDDVFNWQAAKSDFAQIDASTLLHADVCTNEHNADKAIRASHKLGVINTETGHGDTTRIDRLLVNKMSSMSVRKQRQFVQLMFFMEEEVTRWRLLTTEEDTLVARIGSEGSDGRNLPEITLMLEKLRADKKVPPSRREASGEIHGVESGEQLPRYEDVGRA
jgi:hypothetical protein